MNRYNEEKSNDDYFQKKGLHVSATFCGTRYVPRGGEGRAVMIVYSFVMSFNICIYI